MKKIWTNGCFDVLHVGHLKMLEFAKRRGDYLVVGIDSDSRVKKLKGDGRPFNNESDRKEFLEAIKFVDEVVIFDSPEHLNSLILSLQISEIVVGEEYKKGLVLGSDLCPVEFFPRIGEYSTSKILSERIYSSK